MADKAQNTLRTSGSETAKPEWAAIGTRITSIRGSVLQPDMARRLGVSKTTYSRWERGVREIGADGLKRLVELGWNPMWLLTGEGPERLEALQDKGSEVVATQSQPAQLPDLKIAIKLTEEALDGRTLGPDDYAQLVTLIYDALVNGLPSAQVLAFARPASRGLSGDTGDGESTMGGSGAGTAGKGGAATR